MDYRQSQPSKTELTIHTNRGSYDKHSYDNLNPYDFKKDALMKQSKSKESSSTFLKSTSSKVIAIIGVIAGVCALAGGAAGLAYYLGTLSKIESY
jgi:hypothetical protein